MEKTYEEMYRYIDKITKNKKYSNQGYKRATTKLNKILSKN